MWQAIYKEAVVSIGDMALQLKVQFKDPKGEIRGEKEYSFPIVDLTTSQTTQDAVNTIHNAVNTDLNSLKTVSSIISSIIPV